MAVGINTGGAFTASRADSADTATGWSVVKLEGSGGAPSLLASVGTIDLVAEGTDARAARTNKQRILIRYNHSAGYDFTSGSTGTGTTKVPNGIAYVWSLFLAAGSLFTKANGGMQVALSDGTNTSYWNVAGSDTYTGGFYKWAALTTTTPSETSGTAADLGNITFIGVVTDVGGTTTRFDNFVVDAIDVGDGLEFNGTTTTNSLFAESLATDEATAIGVMSSNNGKVFAQGNLRFSGTSMISESESLTFTDTLGGAYTYQCEFTGTVTLTNSSIDQDGAVDFNYDTTSATSFTHNGGTVKGFNTVTTNSGDDIKGIVFQSGGTSTIGDDLANTTFNECGTATVTGTVTDCTFNNATSDAASTADTGKIITSSFTKGATTANAVVLTGAAATYGWTSGLSGYDAGTAGGEGVNVAVTGGSITGSEAIHITASSGTFRISVTAGDTPSVSSAGAVVYVIAGEKTFTQTISPVPTPNYEYRLYTVTAEGSMAGAVEITAEGEENATTGSHTYTHTETSQPIAVQVISNDYVEKISYYTLTAADLSVTINLEIDNND